MFQNRFDEFYLTICKETGGIEGLLQSFFDFMLRKTDFFYECDPGDKMGFPPGYSRQLLLNTFDRFQEEHYKKIPKKSKEQYEAKLAKYKASKSSKSTKPSNNIEKKQQKPEPESHQPSQKKEEMKPKSSTQPIIDTYNGGKTDRYSWSQQSKDVEVTIQIQSGINAKMLNVCLKPESISIRKKTGQLILEGELAEKINAADSVWKIQRAGEKTLLTLNLEKAQDKIWSTVLKGDSEIDTTKVNNTKPLQDFDDETQGAIRKIMYEQQRKQMGLPTTEEEKQIEALKQAWDAEGSPFKGQPFDPSKFNLPGSSFKPE